MPSWHKMNFPSSHTIIYNEIRSVLVLVNILFVLEIVIWYRALTFCTQKMTIAKLCSGLPSDIHLVISPPSKHNRVEGDTI